MIDWKKVYSNQILPIIDGVTSLPPLWLLIIFGALFFGGVSLMIWAPVKGKLAGLVLLFMVGFITYMATNNYYGAKNKDAHFEIGAITKKFSKMEIKNLSTGFSHKETVYYVEFEMYESYILTKAGKGKALNEEIGKQQYSVSLSMYEKLNEGEQINAVFSPNGGLYCFIRPDGSVIK